MPTKQSVTGSELFIVDNSDEDWKVLRDLYAAQARVGKPALKE